MTTFFIADLHLGHKNILQFEHNGSPLRPFKTLDEMHTVISVNWNNVVKDTDKVYVLGDVALSKKYLDILLLLKGEKILIRGNHDTEKASTYLKYFKDIRAYDHKPGYILSHIPIHPNSVERFKLNIHGHLHANTLSDPRYFNVSCEQVSYTPISWEEVQEKTK